MAMNEGPRRRIPCNVAPRIARQAIACDGGTIDIPGARYLGQRPQPFLGVFFADQCATATFHSGQPAGLDFVVCLGPPNTIALAEYIDRKGPAVPVRRRKVVAAGSIRTEGIPV